MTTVATCLDRLDVPLFRHRQGDSFTALVLEEERRYKRQLGFNLIERLG